MDIATAKSIIETNYNDVKNANNITLNTDSETPFIEVKGFSDMSCISHGFTTRLGGVSDGIFESLNMGFYVGDDREKVLENYKRISDSIGFDMNRMSCPNQVHKTNVLVVTEDDAGDGVVRDLSHFEIDAQITNVRNLPLICYGADCVPILLADPISRVIGTVHAGWRGTVDGIAAKTVEKMVEVYGCLPENIHAVIGPSIGPDNYEVDQTVIDGILACPYVDMSEENLSLKEAGKDLYVSCGVGSFVRDNMPKDYVGRIQPTPGPYIELFRTVNIKNRFMLNLWNLNQLILLNAGLKNGNIYNTRLCTMKHHDLFFSHRFTKGKRGLNAGIIVLN